MPSTSIPKPAALATPPAAASAQGPTEIIERPPQYTLARGKYEAKPFTIWLVVALGLLAVLIYALVRVRRAAREKQLEVEALSNVLRKGGRARS